MKKASTVDKEISSTDKPQKEADLTLRQNTIDSGFADRMDTQNMTSYIANPVTSTDIKSLKNANISNHSSIQDQILGQAMEIPSLSTEDSTHNSVDQPIEFSSNINYPKSSSTPVDASNVTGIHSISISQIESSQLQELFNEQKSHDNSVQVQNYSYPDIYENFSISLLTGNDSSILKLSNNSSILEGPQNLLARQSSFNKSADISDFGTFIAEQEENSIRNLSQLPVIALRDFSGYHDNDIDKDNEILVRVTSANFDKIYVVTKINDERNLNEFCKSPLSSRSKLFLLNGSKENKEIEIKKIGTNSMKLYCGKGHEGRAEDYSRNSLLSSSNHEKFTVQKIDETSKSPGIDIHVTENSDKNSNFTVIKEQSHVTHTQN